MRFTEIDLLGVYVAPITLVMVAAWLVTIGLRRGASRFGLPRNVWHLAMFVFDVVKPAQRELGERPAKRWREDALSGRRAFRK